MKKRKFLITFCAVIVMAMIVGDFGIKKMGMTYALEEKPVLKSFDLTTTELNQGEKLYYNIDYDYSGNISFIGLWAKEKTSGSVFYVSTQDLSNGYFDLAKDNGNTHKGFGTFEVTGLTFGLYGGIYYYSLDGCEDLSSCGKYDFSDMSFTIKNAEEETSGIYDYILTGKTKSASVGEKIHVTLGSPESFNGKKIEPKELENVLLSYTNNNDNSVINVYLKSLDNNPYFIIPSTATVGTYYLDYGYLTYIDGTSEKCKDLPGKVFSYDSSFNVIEKKIDTTKFVFNNEEYNLLVENELSKLDNDAILTINANNLPIIDKSIFESIQSTKRTLFIEYQNSVWVFSGSDITSPKSIEVSVVIEDLLTSTNSDDFLKNTISSKAAIVKFNNNGDLPGKVLVKLNSTEVEKYIDGDVIYIYYYNEEKQELSKVAMEVQKNNGFYEFYINHNSKYILTSDEVEEKEVSNNTLDMELNNNNSQVVKSYNKLYIIMGTAIALIIVCCLSIITIKTKRRNKK